MSAKPSSPSRFRVVVTDFIAEPLDPERESLGDIAEVVALNATSEPELAGRIEDADAIMIYHLMTLRADTIARLEKCKVIVRPGVGYDNIDIHAARERGIPVANVPDYGTEEVADSALAMLLSLARGTHLLNSRLRRGAGDWSYTQTKPLSRLRHRGLGIIGLGRIGTAVALRGKALGMDVRFYDPYIPDGVDKAVGITRVDTLSELLASSYALSIHCPLTPETRNLIDAGAIAQLPKGAFLINNARGGIVDTAAVVRAIETGHLAGAGIDVLETEPPRDDDPVIVAWRDPAHPAHDRLILNPHAAFYCEEGMTEFRVKGSANVRRALLGERLRNVVNA